MQMIPYADKPIVDGFTYSLSRLPAASSYYENCIAQMEVLRRANGYKLRIYNVPDDFNSPIAGFGTLEYQVRTQPGAYLYAYLGSIINGEKADVLFQVTDACTETKLFSDFVLFSSVAETTAGVGLNRPPCLLAQPFLVGPPGLMNVELSNRASTSRTCQLLLFFAEPSLPMNESIELLAAQGHQL